jgi:PAS domain S-box-containing protein
LQKLNKDIIFTAKISALLHTLQKERGLSIGDISNQKDIFTKELIAQRKTTDIKLSNFLQYSKTEHSKEFLQLLNNISFKIKYLHNIREKILNKTLTSNEIILYYSSLNEKLLNLLIEVTKESFIPKITQNLLAYSYMIYTQEFAGIQRALGVSIIQYNKLHQDEYIRFTNYISMQSQYIDMFLKYASQKTIDKYQYIKSKPSFREVQKIQNIILYNQNLKNINSKHWFDMMTDKINSYQIIVDYIKKQTKYNIEAEISYIGNIFYLVLGLTIISMIIFIFMIISFLKLAKEEQKLRVIMDKYIISSITDTKGKIIDASEAFCKISGFPKQELIGQPHNIVRHPDMPKEAFKELWGTIKQGKTWRGKVKNKTKDGGFYWVYANIEPLYDKHGNIDSYISIRLDITESEILQSKIQQQSRLAQMGEMLSMIAHQWRQPLSAISASAVAIYLKASRGKLDDENAIKLANKIKELSQHLSSTIDDFRGFAKDNKAKIKTDFETILQSILNIVSDTLEQNNIKLNLDIKSNEQFLTYENEVKQVLLNIVKNAEDILIDNNIPDPKIDIVIENNKITIEDNAGGVPEDIIDKIFDPYFSTKMQKDGTGLGLYMSKTIIEDHCKGGLDVQNINNGARFTIILGDIDE